MAYYEDLSHFAYIEDRGPSVRNAGWLEAGHEFASGTVTAAEMAALERLALHTWQPVFCRGWHDCSLCGRPSGPIERVIEGQRKILGADIMFVPDGDVLYAIPTLALHYIEQHGYRPPDAVLAAVRAIDPTSAAYRERCERIWSAGAPRDGLVRRIWRKLGLGR